MADKNYSEAGFWQKLNTFARKAGHESRREISTTFLRRRIARYAQSGQKAW